jgi:dolichol-phosphate mannosyltransferase
MDSDLQHPPELIPELIRLWREGNDVVAAVRKFTRGASAFKNVTSLGFYALFNFLSETRISAGAADFCLLSRRALEAVNRMPERHRFLRGMIAWTGFPRAELPYEAASRAAGRSKYTVGKMMRLALDALFAFTGEPVRFTARVGMFVMACGFLYLVYVVSTTLFVGGTDKGWPSLICTVLILGGLQLFCIGLLGEYLVRVYEEAKGRPLYLFKQTPRRSESSTDGLRARTADELERSSSAHDP